MGLSGYIDEDSGNIWVNDGDGMRLQGFFDRESGNIWTHDGGGGGDGRGAWGCFIVGMLLMTSPIWGIALIAGCQALQRWHQQARPRGQAVPAVIQPDAEAPYSCPRSTPASSGASSPCITCVEAAPPSQKYYPSEEVYARMRSMAPKARPPLQRYCTGEFLHVTFRLVGM